MALLKVLGSWSWQGGKQGQEEQIVFPDRQGTGTNSTVQHFPCPRWKDHALEGRLVPGGLQWSRKEELRGLSLTDGVTY
jgi:hypothetical protein